MFVGLTHGAASVRIASRQDPSFESVHHLSHCHDTVMSLTYTLAQLTHTRESGSILLYIIYTANRYASLGREHLLCFALLCVCVYVCVCARARACVGGCVRACVRGCHTETDAESDRHKCFICNTEQARWVGLESALTTT